VVTARARGLGEDARVARRARTLNKTPWLNRRAVREELLRLAKELRPFHSYTRVSEETLVQLSWHFRQAMIWHVKSMPSKGRTI